ncbi:MAG TPA: N-acetyl-gamma-glutamyl-phosphate reductase, partial [Planctomycetota bacterium]|nr:N-acetyl-gamma-glutamyl-phosphate reductase [Planctomycetota bacterium]
MRAEAREPVFTTVYGGHGYAAGELIRLLAGHPTLRLGAVASSSQAGRPVVEAFPHLAGAVDDALRFVGADDVPALLRGRGRAAAFFATPHGATAPLVAEALRRAAEVDCALRCVDLSADFRFPDAEAYRAVYGAPHGAPQLIPEFTCAPPDLRPGRPPAHAVQPGCFTTCVVLAAAPFLAAGIVEPDVFASAITGSSGSGATPAANTHHPERRSNLYAYGPLVHRHEPEMRRLLAEAAGGAPIHVDFVPHSGPFVRGIHATVRMRLVRDVAA